MTGADRGTVLPLVLLSFLLAGLLVTAGTAASAAFLAQRDLAGVCDGAALAGAAALDRAALARPRPGADGVGPGLPLDRAEVAAAVGSYRHHAARPGLVLTAGTDGRTVTVTCRRTVRIPFGAVLGKAGGLDRTAVARARTALLPAG